MPLEQPAAPAGRIDEPAPAKLNLYLHVVGRRPDGYHLLDSLVAFATVADRVTVAAADRPSFSVSGRYADAVPTDRSNLAWQAVEALAAAVGRRPDVTIDLAKQLPVAAGIGGGSADAAAVLRALARLWDVPAGDPRLAELAAGLGADVPACLWGRSCFVGGIGERLDPAPPLTGTPVVLVNPGVPLATPAVFKARSGAFSSTDRFAVQPAGPAELGAWLARRRNDLTDPACRLCPAIPRALAALQDTDGCLLARMSGSGATCFGLYAQPGQAQAAAGLLAARQPDWWIAPGELL